MKKRVAIIALLCLLLSLAGTASVFRFPRDDDEVRAKTVELISALSEKDVRSCRALLSEDHYSNEDISIVINDFSPSLSNLTGYELDAVSRHIITDNNGVTTKIVQYLLSTPNSIIYLNAVVRSDYEGLVGFSLLSLQNNDHSAPAIFNYSPSAPQFAATVLVLTIGLLEVVYVGWMFTDCLRRRIEMKKMILWEALILFGSLILNFSLFRGEFNLSFNYSAVNILTTLSIFKDAQFSLKIFLPIGALIYYMRRNSMKPLYPSKAFSGADTSAGEARSETVAENKPD